MSASGFDWRRIRVGKVDWFTGVAFLLTVTGAVRWGVRSSVEHNEKRYVAVNYVALLDCVNDDNWINLLYRSNQIRPSYWKILHSVLYLMLKLNEILMQHILMWNHCLYEKAKAVQICFVWTIVRVFTSMWSLSHSFDYRGILRPTETGKRLVFDPRMSCSCAILKALGGCKHPFLVLDSWSTIHTFFLQISSFHISFISIKYLSVCLLRDCDVFS